MEFDELLITTGVDALVRLVKEKQKIELDVASKLLNIDTTKIEDWARILEEEGILRIEYRLTKVYLLWTNPSEEDVKKETSSFYEEKNGLVTELEGIKSRVGDQTESLHDIKKSFSELYDKLSPQFKSLESELASLASAGKIDVGQMKTKSEQVEKINIKLDDVARSVSSLKSIIDSLKDSNKEKIEIPETTDHTALKRGLADLSDQLAVLDKKIASVSKSYPEEAPSSSELRKKFDLLKKEFGDMKQANGRLREDLIGLHESSDIIITVAESSKKYGGTITDIKSQLSELLKEVENINIKSSAMSVKIKDDIEAMVHFSDSINVANGILSRFPSQDKVLKQLNATAEKEIEIDSKLAVLDKVLSSFSMPKNVLEELTRIRDDIETKRDNLSEEADTVFKAMEDQSTTYATFQKIKEKTLVSLEAYETQLVTVEEALEKLRTDAVDIDKALSLQAGKFKDKIKSENLDSLIKSATELQTKKEQLDSINKSINDLSNTSDNLTKRINLLTKQAELLELRTSTVATLAPREKEARAAKEEEVRSEVKLTRDEEADFNRKREELRELIKKLWEQS
ncbi:MAG: hypothetical protein Q7S22_05755 [Candidatus Micrarchaeota archaeon]|nr:hypothetical protein [Candidatus Micrarchaeota archaeon]